MEEKLVLFSSHFTIYYNTAIANALDTDSEYPRYGQLLVRHRLLLPMYKLLYLYTLPHKTTKNFFLVYVLITPNLKINSDCSALQNVAA